MNPPKPSHSEHPVLIADHLWEAVDQMAKEMGIGRDALVNQALFTFARLNGYLVPNSAEGRSRMTGRFAVDHLQSDPESMPRAASTSIGSSFVDDEPADQP